MLSDTEKAHIEALGYGKTAPSSGFERHFLRVIRGEGRWACSQEKDWLDYWLSIQAAARHEEGRRHSAQTALAIKPPSNAGSELGGDVPRRAHPFDSAQGRSTASRSHGESGPTSIIDLAVVATSVSSGIHSVDQVKAEPLLQKAIELTTQRPIEEFASDPAMLQGAINAAKGRYFELLVEEKLNAGETVGGLCLQPDERFELASSMTQPGWDGVVLDSSGRLVERIQLKATDSTVYLRETLARYPDIQIVATSEAAGQAVGALKGLVLDSGIDDATLERLVNEAFSADSAADNFLDAFNPLLPLVLVAASEGYTVKLGRKSVEEAFASGLSRGKHSLTGSAVGAVFTVLGLGWFSVIPAVWAAAKGPEKLIQDASDLFSELQKGLERGKDNYRKVRESEAARQIERTRLRIEQHKSSLEKTPIICSDTPSSSELIRAFLAQNRKV